MSNEQLYILLSVLADNIENLSDEIRPLVEHQIKEPKFVWVGEGPEPTGFLTGLNQFTNSKDLEMQPVGEFTAVAKVKEFSEKIHELASSLKGAQDE